MFHNLVLLRRYPSIGRFIDVFFLALLPERVTLFVFRYLSSLGLARTGFSARMILGTLPIPVDVDRAASVYNLHKLYLRLWLL